MPEFSEVGFLECRLTINSKLATSYLFYATLYRKGRIMPNQVLSFMNNNSNIRVIVDSTNEVLFCLADICKALELTNPSRVKEYLIAEFDEDDLTSSYPIKDNLGRTQNATFITESQLYYVLNTSRSAKAKPFRKWVNKEILPSIRKTGSYSIQQQLPKTYGEALLEAGRLAIENEKLLTQAKENQPKIEAFNELMSSSDSLDFLTFSKIIKIGRNTLFKKLRELKILRKDNIPYQAYVDRGYFKVIESTYRYNENEVVKISYKTTVLPKGQIFIINLLKNPTSENPTKAKGE